VASLGKLAAGPAHELNNPGLRAYAPRRTLIGRTGCRMYATDVAMTASSTCNDQSKMFITARMGI
jgi:C4-dicarboxylate-specific signal transduction histidine kinase